MATIEAFECPVCIEIPNEKTTIFFCPSQHLICQGCFDRLPSKTCPTCRTDFATPPSENPMLQNLLKTSFDLKRTCRYYELGCRFSGTRGELVDHETVCGLISYIKCRFCLKVQGDGLLYVCAGGRELHHLCRVCYEDGQICCLAPCEGLFSDEPVRDRIAEAIAQREDIPLPCKFQGCEFEGFKRQFAEHEKSCEHKVFRCPYLTCDSTVRFHDVVEHFKETHGAGILKRSGGAKTYKAVGMFKSAPDEDIWPEIDEVWFSEDGTFLFCRNNAGLVHIWAQRTMTDGEEIASCQISLGGRESKIRLKCPIYSIEEGPFADRLAMRPTGACVELTQDTFKMITQEVDHAINLELALPPPVKYCAHCKLHTTDEEFASCTGEEKHAVCATCVPACQKFTNGMVGRRCPACGSRIN